MTFVSIRGKTEKRRAGFTLTELLVAVAIILVLALVVLLALTTIQRRLRQKELDSKAEIIYMSAQNRIAELRASGYEKSYQPDDANGVLRLNYVPCDAETVTELKDDTLCYVSSEDKDDSSRVAYLLMPASTVDEDLRQHDWRIEYNPVSGSIYGVFYSETGDIPEAREADDYRIHDYRLKKGAKVGYYGGDVTDVVTADVLSPEIRITNGEKLVATFYCSTPSAAGSLTFTITLSDGTNTYEKVITNPSKINSRTYSYTWILDSLESDETRFLSQTENKLTCGTELEVRLTVSSDSPRIDDKSTSAVTNSLFADPREDADASTALIACGRHLQNLDSASGVSDSITKAVQISDISFADDTGDSADWYSYYSKTYYCPTGFHPITNANLTSYDGHSSLDGKDLYSAIYSLNIQKPDDCTDLGLFSTFTGSISNVTMTGTKIGAETDTDTSVGAVVGRAGTSLNLQNCRVYLNSQRGELDNITETENPEEVQPWLQGGTVGGLIGTVGSGSAVSVDGSLAASVLSASQNAGGLIGMTDGTVGITGSYADCYLKGDTTGGLVGGTGTASALTLERFYAAGYQTAATAAAGLVPGSVTSASNGYAAFDYTDVSIDKLYSTAASAGTVSNVYYLSGFGGNHVDIDGADGKTYDELTDSAMLELLGSDFTLSSGDASFPYNLLTQGLTYYNYPRLAAMNHYGDWPTEFESGALVYYEVYKNADGTYAYGFSGGNIETLKTSGEAVGDGYALAYSDKPDADVTVTAFGNTYTVKPENLLETTDSNGDTYWLLPLPSELNNPDVTLLSDGFYQSIKVDDDEYYFNPYLAKTVTVNETRPEAPKTISVRTARQLYALSRLYPSYAAETSGSLFQQELNIDYLSYEWTKYAGTDEAVTTQEPITSTSGFVARYDGRCHTIRNVSFRSDGYQIGLFGRVAESAELRNIFLIAGEGENAGTVSYGSVAASGSRHSVSMGSLAGYNSGIIRNCVASGYSMTYYGYYYNVLSLGGLVGTNYGTIRSCEANTASVEIAATNASSYAGGFVGTNRGTIAQCYAVGEITVKDARSSTVRIAGFAADNESGIIRYSYSAAALTASGSAESYGFARIGGTVVGCSYLDGGTFSYADELYAYNASKNRFAAAYAAGNPASYSDLTSVSRMIYGFSGADVSYDHDKTGEPYDIYPYPAVVTDAEGNVVHYGDWPIKKDIGTLGVFYWEYESGGSNTGYHFSYVGTSNGSLITDEDAVPTLGGSSLCEEHDDGGVITEYGYGYFWQSDAVRPVFGTDGCSMPAAGNTSASAALGLQMPGYTFVAYDTASTDGKNGIYITGEDDATWTLTYEGCTYTYTVSPFFADAISLDKVVLSSGTTLTDVQTSLPGTDANPYEVRSVRQLQFINWNYGRTTAKSSITSNNVNEYTGSYNNSTYKRTQYSYLVYSDQNDPAQAIKNLYWQQSHDMDSAVEYANGYDFEPIGCLYETSSDRDTENSNPYLALFTSSFDGQAYAIKNISISSTSQCIGLFGMTAAAELKDIVMYSDNGSVIEHAEGSDNWYSVGGLVGFATKGNDNLSQGRTATISNCSVSGYRIEDYQSKEPGWGGGMVGGLVGATNMNLTKCTAVTDITLGISGGYLTKGYKNLRVGGLVGVARSTITDCYAGGSIKSTATGGDYDTSKLNSLENYNVDSRANIWVSGIAGGIVLRCGGSLGELIGGVKNQLQVENCYSYVEMPKSGSNYIVASSSIASNGELQSGRFTLDVNGLGITNVSIKNCYCLDSAVALTDDYKEYHEGTAWTTAGVSINYRADHYNYNNYWTQLDYTNRRTFVYNSSTPYLTYTEMTDGTLLVKLGGDGNPFSTVTVTEHGAQIDGKYSYPGNDASLEGLNYPFPTILQQTDAFGRTVNVHYGAWPKYGLVWQEPTASLDLIADLDDSGYAVLDWKLYDIENGDTAPTGNVTFTYALEDADPDDSAEVTAIAAEVTGKYAAGTDDVSGYYNVRFRADGTGTYIVTASDGTNTAVLHVTVTAELKLEVTSLLTLHYGETSDQTIRVTDADGNAFVPAAGKQLDWAVEVVYDTANVEIKPVDAYADQIKKKSADGEYSLPILGFSVGEATVNITCSYNIGDGTQAVTGRAVISASTVADSLGLSGDTEQTLTPAYTADKDAAGQVEGTNAETVSSDSLCLYMTRTHGDSCLSLDAFSVTAATVTVGESQYPVDLTSGLTENNAFRLTLGEVQSSDGRQTRPLTLSAADARQVTLTLTLGREGDNVSYTLSVSCTTAADASLTALEAQGADDAAQGDETSPDANVIIPDNTSPDTNSILPPDGGNDPTDGEGENSGDSTGEGGSDGDSGSGDESGGSDGGSGEGSSDSPVDRSVG